MLRTEDGHHLIRRPTDVRVFAREATRIGRPYGVFLFSGVDTHAHVAAECSAPRARQLAGALARTLRNVLELDARLERPRVEPIEGPRHVRSLVPYILGNADRHGVRHLDPLLEATNLPDLLRLHPRLTRAALRQILGLVPEPGAHLGLLAEAAAGGIGSPDLTGTARQVVAARIAAAHVGRELGATTRQLGALLGVTPRSVRQLLTRSVDPGLLRAVSLQLGLREVAKRNEPPSISR